MPFFIPSNHRAYVYHYLFEEPGKVKKLCSLQSPNAAILGVSNQLMFWQQDGGIFTTAISKLNGPCDLVNESKINLTDIDGLGAPYGFVELKGFEKPVSTFKDPCQYPLKYPDLTLPITLGNGSLTVVPIPFLKHTNEIHLLLGLGELAAVIEVMLDKQICPNSVSGIDQNHYICEGIGSKFTFANKGATSVTLYEISYWYDGGIGKFQ